MTDSVHYQFHFIDWSPQMPQVGEFFYVVVENYFLRSNIKIFESHKNCECYESKEIQESNFAVWN